MALQKKKKEEPGVPEWVVTFGDLMSLLLTFFILLQMFSELKQDHEYQRVITAIKEAFGYSGGIGVLPTDDPPLNSIVQQMQHMALKNYDNTKISQSKEDGLDGPHMRVTKVRDGEVYTIGGAKIFEEYSAVVRPHVAKDLRKLAVMLAGRRNKIVIRGHAAAKYLPEGSPWKNLDELSYARASNVKDILVAAGLDDTVFRLEAVGMREPYRPRASNPEDRAENRRVEIILSEQLVDDMNTDASFTDPDLARGGLNDG